MKHEKKSDNIAKQGAGKKIAFEEGYKKQKEEGMYLYILDPQKEIEIQKTGTNERFLGQGR